MNKTWFRRLLLSYLPVFFIVTMILFILFFQALNEQNRSEALKANNFLGQQVLSFTDSSLKSIDYKVLRETLINEDVKRFFASDKKDVYDNIQAVKAMDELKLNFPLIHSIYFVRFSDGFVLGAGTSSSLTDFPDSGFIRTYMQNDLSSRWTGIRSFKAFASVDSEKVITLVRGFPDTGRKEGLFVVNVSAAALKHAIQQMYNPGISFVKLLDLQGNDVLGSADKEAKADARNVITKLSSDYTEWSVQSGLVHGEIVNITLSLYKAWVALAAAIVLIGLAWLLYITRRNYKPIQQIVTLIQAYSQNYREPGKTGNNEIQFIQSALETMMEQTKQFQQQFKENVILQKKYYFHEVLEGSRPIGEEEWAAELRKFHFPASGKAYVVLVTEIDGYHAFAATYKSEDQSLLKLVVSSVIQETASEFGAAVWSEWTTERRLSSILWVPGDAVSDESVYGIVNAFRTWMEQKLSFTVTVGQGHAAKALDELRKSYQAAINALQYKAVLGANRVIPLEHVPLSKPELREHIKIVYFFAHAFRLSDDGWKKHLEQLFEQIAETLLPRQAIESLVHFLMQHLDKEFAELSKEYLDTWRGAMPELQQLARDWEMLSELRSGFERIFQTMSDRMQSLHDSRSRRALIMEIRSFIEEEYANPDLSLDYLSDKYQLSGKYVSKLFKEECGENFVDYLIGLRIAKAKKMLSETQKSIQEIGQEVGYSNYNSFNRSFKNVVGVSPRDFRKQACAS